MGRGEPRRISHFNKKKAPKLVNLVYCEGRKTNIKSSMKNQGSKGVSGVRGILPVVKDVESPRKSQEKKHWGPFKPLPNVRKFSINIGKWDGLFLRLGISKRTEAEMSIEPGRNNRLNRYMYMQLSRMNKADPTTYGAIADSLMRHSKVFFAMALFHVFPRGHRDHKLGYIMSLAKSFYKKVNDPEAVLEYDRRYIEKANGKLRPLGAPTPVGRLIMHMGSQLLVHYLDTRNMLSETQHAYRPNRGTLTAGRVILEEVLKAEYIFEFDLKGFFDSVELGYINYMLRVKQIPEGVIEKLHRYNKQPARSFKNPYADPAYPFNVLGLSEHDKEVNLFYGDKPDKYLRGVPQGVNTSPLLATLALENTVQAKLYRKGPPARHPISGEMTLYQEGMSNIMYADDGLYYGDEPMDIDMENGGIAGIKYNDEKSGGVKGKGEGIKPLKFLGLEYDGVTDKLRSKTRNGISLEYDKHELVKAFEERIKAEYEDYLDEDTESGRTPSRDSSTFGMLARSKLFGFIQSRLYQGSGNLNDYEQDFELKYIKDSGTEKFTRSESLYYPIYRGNKVSVFNSSSFAAEWLVAKLSGKDMSELKTIIKSPIGEALNLEKDFFTGVPKQRSNVDLMVAGGMIIMGMFSGRIVTDELIDEAIEYVGGEEPTRIPGYGGGLLIVLGVIASLTIQNYFIPQDIESILSIPVAELEPGLVEQAIRDHGSVDRLYNFLHHYAIAENRIISEEISTPIVAWGYSPSDSDVLYGYNR